MGFHLIVPLAEKPKFLYPLVHEHSVQLSVLHCSNLDGLATPTHDVGVTNQSCMTRAGVHYTETCCNNHMKVGMYTHSTRGSPMEEGTSPHCNLESFTCPPLELT